MFRRGSRQQRSMFSLAGWLFADLFLVLTMLFFTNASAWVPPNQPQPKQICGIDQTVHKPIVVTVPDPSGLRQGIPSAMKSFDAVVKKTLAGNASRSAGFVEVHGGNPYNNATDGQRFATGAIKALKLLAAQHFIFTSQTIYFDAQWSGKLPTNQVSIYILYLLVSTSCQGQSNHA